MSQLPINFLLIAPEFFGYAKEIQHGLAKRGVGALRFDDRPASDTMTKILNRISPLLQRDKADRYFDSIFQQAKQHPITHVLVIKGQSLSLSAIRRMREALPHAHFTLYFWDSYKNMSSDSYDKVALFDRALSFDPVDVENDGRLEYRALFYLDEYAKLPKVDEDIDFFFFGTIHSDRYQVLKKLSNHFPRNASFKKILYFPSKLIYWGRRLFQPSFWMAKKREFTFEPVGKADLKSLLARSKVIIDIERPIQAGLTMRTLEAVGAKKKIITTNSFSAKTDIYRPENILVIDRDNIFIPESFIMSEFCELPGCINQKYSLDGWLDEIFPFEKLGTAVA
ncbi:hypothetical protein ACWYXJ_20255 [Janthinobacterium lividum]